MSGMSFPLDVGAALVELALLTPALLVLADRANEVTPCACHRPVLSEDEHEANRCSYCHGLLWEAEPVIENARRHLAIIQAAL